MRVSSKNMPFHGQVIFKASEKGVQSIEFSRSNIFLKVFGWDRYFKDYYFTNVDHALSKAVDLGWDGKLSKAKQAAVKYFRRHKTL